LHRWRMRHRRLNQAGIIMLINTTKQIQVGDIIGVVTIGGMEALCKVEDIASDHFVVRDFKVVIITANGGMSLRSSPLINKKGEPVRLNRATVAMTFIPDDEILQEYKEVVSGIALPKTGGIIT
jgi:hypothetical protein